MKVTINRETRTSGVFKKTTKYIVEPVVEFDQVERAIIEKRGLGNMVVYTTPSDLREGDTFTVTIEELMKKQAGRAFLNMSEADELDHKLKAEILPGLKEFIMRHKDNARTSDSFEL